ncbi:MAG: hypothetical protein ABI744_04155 [Chloroflexota bacterium]
MTQRVSRLPVVFLSMFMAIAIGIVLYLASANNQPVASPPIGSPGTAAAPRPVNLIMRDYHFDPTPLHLYAGETISLTVVNAGMVEHELVLGDSAAQNAWAQADAAATPPAPFATAPPASAPAGTGGLRLILPSGGTMTATYVVPDESLMLACNLPGHRERGMIGEVTLEVR